MTTQGPFLAIDAVCNLHTPETVVRRGPASLILDKVRAKGETETGISIERLLEKMDAGGIERTFLIAAKEGSEFDSHNWIVSYEEVAEVVNRYPDRFSGLAGIDPWTGMSGVRHLESAVRDMGFIGAHVYPHWFRMSPDHAKYYPFYAKCVELGIPIQMQVGRCLIYRADMPPLESVGRPITLDTIACDFPELKLIGIHTGWPWVEEMISVAEKHPNVYIGADAYGPRHWKSEFVQFINTWGQDKVIFGSDYPVLEPERAVEEVGELGLRPEPLRKLLRENAERVYGL